MTEKLNIENFEEWTPEQKERAFNAVKQLANDIVEFLTPIYESMFDSLQELARVYEEFKQSNQ